MAVKKLSIKKKAGKLVIHKKGSKDADSEVVGKVSVDGEVIGDVTDVTLKVTEEDVLSNKPVPKKKMKIKAKNKQGAEVKAKVTIKESGEEEQVEEEVLEEIEVSKHMANVGFSIGRSINMGNYESLKVQVSINVPSEVDEDEIEGNYEYAKGWCEQKLEGIIAEYAEE